MEMEEVKWFIEGKLKLRKKVFKSVASAISPSGHIKLMSPQRRCVGDDYERLEASLTRRVTPIARFNRYF